MSRFTLIPSQQILNQLNLKLGENSLVYVISDSLYLSCRIFLFNENSRIFISDIDGTVIYLYIYKLTIILQVTKSDFMGYVMNYSGKTYSHDGICECYHRIREKGYHIIYLSARSLQQYDATRAYLERDL